MLVLTRKPGQSVFLGDQIKITLHGIRGNQVRLGIDAPPHVKIYREEIYLQILEENKAAAADSPADLGDVAKAWADRKDAALTVFSKKQKQSKRLEDDDE